MKAYIYEKYGKPDVLQLAEVATPQTNDDEILVKVKAVCINDFDWGLLIGKPFITRISQGLIRPKKNKILGSDIAGEVVEVGANISKFKVGDKVYGDQTDRWGGFSEYVIVKEKSIEHMSENMSYEDAAAIPQAGMLAYQAMYDIGNLKKDMDILINGAGGGVGTFAIQIAKLYNARVTGVDNSVKQDMMIEAGFDRVVDFQKTDITKMKLKFDLIVDNKSYRSPFKYINCLKPEGTYVTTGGAMIRLLQIVLLSPVIKRLYRKNFKLVVLNVNRELKAINKMYEQGNFKPWIESVYSFEHLIDAMKCYEKSEHKGKLVISIK